LTPRRKRILYIGNKLAAHGRTPTNIDTLGPLLEGEGYELQYAGTHKKQIPRLAQMLSAIWEHRNNTDVVLIDTYSTTAFYFAWLSGLLCKKLNIKYIPILHGGNLPARLQNSPGLSRQFFGNSIMNIAVSGYLHEHVLKYGFKSTIIENTINLNNYPFKLREHLPPRLLWVRAFHETYNPVMAINVAGLLKEKYPNIHLTMIGPELDGSMEVCKKMSVEKKLDKNITFTGKLSKEEWIRLSTEYDVFINTTYYDNLPVSVIEAMALGLPVVSTNVGGIPYLIDDNKTGLLVDADDANAMADKIEELISGNIAAKNISISARRYVEQFDWNIVKNKWYSLFNTV
jgi:glycosyltransferase involved in cell wall biosynthesis